MLPDGTPDLRDVGPTTDPRLSASDGLGVGAEGPHPNPSSEPHAAGRDLLQRTFVTSPVSGRSPLLRIE